MKKMYAFFGLCLGTVILAAASNPASAADDKDPYETKVIQDRPEPLALKPDKAYILLKTQNMAVVTLLHLPTEQEAAAYKARRATELVKEHSKWEKKLAQWERDTKNYQPAPNVPKPGPRPVEPTEETFVFPDYDQVHTVSFGPEFRFAKKDGSAYLQEVPPGEYVFYGNFQGCACLGTVSFEAAAGKVTAFSLDLPVVEAGKGVPFRERPKSNLDMARGTASYRLSGASFADPRLPEGTVIPARLKPAGTRANWNGGEVDRVAAIEGVFHYERDKQVAEAAPLAAVSPAQ